MNSFIQFLNRISSKKTLVLALLIYSIFPAYFLRNAEKKINFLTGKKVEIIDLGLLYNPERTKSLLATYTPEAREYYASVEASIDVAYPIAYAFLLSIILVLVFRKNSFKTPKWIPILPVITLIFDYSENYFIYGLLINYPNINFQNIIFCELAKTGKWMVLCIIALLILYEFFNQLFLKFFKK